ncbi:MAG: permease prefix domain 1-containing protein [Planctomycetes bacterium]|nr:permease prefix domain 1-containing protein [Planctomycetota bacterium]
MSEREFETYLTLLCRLLRLDAAQREAIARELRDHLEERLAELKARGVDREEAVRVALAEFGDAAGLAAEFSWISRNLRRRWLVRATLGSMMAAAAAVLAALAMWPDGRTGPAPATAVAQQPANGAAEASAAPETAEAEAPEDILSRRLDAEFIETPLADVLAFLADSVGGQVYVSRKQLDDAAISLDAPVTLSLKSVRVDMLLDLLLDQVDEGLAYVVRDGIVIVSTLEDLEGTAEVRVYNVRDLIKLSAASAGMEGMMGAGGYGAEGAGEYGAYGGEMSGELYGEYGMSGFGGEHPSEHRAHVLMEVIKAAVGRKHWKDDGDYGAIAAYDGLIVVNHNTRVHQQVDRLLEMMRAAAGEGRKGAKP